MLPAKRQEVENQTYLKPIMKSVIEPDHDRPISIVIEDASMPCDDEKLSLVCRTRDGLLHRAMPLAYPSTKPNNGQRVVTAVRKVITGREAVIMIEVD
jgi:hypothetical protein